MDVDTEWSRVLRILQVTEDQWVQNVLPKAREQHAIDVIEENMLTRPKTEQLIVDLHICIQHVNNILRDVAIRLGLPVTVVNSSQI